MRRMRSTVFVALVGAALAIAVAMSLVLKKPHRNLIIFVADGLRYGMVTEANAPAMFALKREGVDFANSHSLFPTVTTANASAIATGHALGDTGDFANSLYVDAPPLKPVAPSLVPFMEDDATLAAMNARFGGNYLGETTLLEAARRAGYQTAAIGKLGPAGIQAFGAGGPKATLMIDDATGQSEGAPLPPDIKAAMIKAGLDPAVPDRGLNTDPGTAIMPGVHVANVEQQDWFARLATEVLLPRFKAKHRPFALVFWSRDPDGTQHNQGDSLNALAPGINGPTSLAAIRNADTDLARLRAAVRRLGLERTTDIIVTSDHGFSTISKASATSPAAKARYADVPKGLLPPGFLALDIGRALDLPVSNPDGLPLDTRGHPKRGSALIGHDPSKPNIVIGANGGADLIWIPHGDKYSLAVRIIAAVSAQDYAGAIFLNDRIGELPGALPMSAIRLAGSARTPRPDLIVAFRHFDAGCSQPQLCAAEVADTDLQQGQGIHGSFGRADTRNMMAAVGPSFRKGFADAAPVSNADWAQTLAHVRGLKLSANGRLVGRVMSEALARGRSGPAAVRSTLRSRPTPEGFTTVLDLQTLDGATYADTAYAERVKAR